jgi:ferrous iron transport protein B
MIQVALFGNPNTGKTSLFNHLTGSYEYVGNWSGVTVEKKIGTLKNGIGQLIDLPGLYSLNPLSKDETVATQFLLNESFTSILNIVDASQLLRNMHLTIQLLEFGKPLAIGLNMVDVARNRGIVVHADKLSKLLNVPVLPIVARTGKGCKELAEVLAQLPDKPTTPFSLDYGDLLENAFSKIEDLLPDNKKINKRWLAIQFFEGNIAVHKYLHQYIHPDDLHRLYKETEHRLLSQVKIQSMQLFIYHVRLKFIMKLIDACVEDTDKSRQPLTNKIDQVVTHKIFGIPIFLLTMFLMFKLTFDWLGSPLSDMLDSFLSGTLTDWIEIGLNSIGASSFIKALVIDGIIAGVGGVLVFVPQIFILFFFISLIEDSGYMARVAMVMDRLMEMIGLNGKAFIPLIIGFGCNVPGVMAARTIEQPKERLLTILLTPLMSCSARLSVYSLFVGTFFAHHQAVIVFSLYLLGVVVALCLAKIFSSTLIKNEFSIFVIELPPYRVPEPLTLWRSTWDKGKGFVKKAGTFIFGGTVAIWILSYAGPGGFDVDINDSFMAMIGGVISPILAPLGFGTWQAASALITGFLAKEVVVSAMNVLYFVPDGGSLQDVIAHSFTPLQAYSFMVFILLYIPCLSTVAVIKKETGSAKWTAFSIAYALLIAYTLSLMIYQVGNWLGIG